MPLVCDLPKVELHVHLEVRSNDLLPTQLNIASERLGVSHENHVALQHGAVAASFADNQTKAAFTSERQTFAANVSASSYSSRPLDGGRCDTFSRQRKEKDLRSSEVEPGPRRIMRAYGVCTQG